MPFGTCQHCKRPKYRLADFDIDFECNKILRCRMCNTEFEPTTIHWFMHYQWQCYREVVQKNRKYCQCPPDTLEERIPESLTFQLTEEQLEQTKLFAARK